ncbi:transcription factor 20-like [Synchiropus picturatus]
MGLGDLHGPYVPVRTLSPSDPCRPPQEDVKDPSCNGCRDDDSVIEPSPRSDDGHLTKAWSRLDEGWIHEDCGIWSTGVFLVRGRLYGLEEAAQLAQHTQCWACQCSGAIMGCFQKGCSRNYHYRCAIQSGCVLNDENFSMRCPEHKNKTVTSGTRHKR